jgi:iron(III) transport system substrate-binding protein
MKFLPRRGSVVVILAATVALLAAGCGSGSDAGSDDLETTGASAGGLASPCTLDALYAAAKKEGTLVRWGGEDPADMQKIYAAFSKEYPGIKFQDAVVNPDEVPTRLLTEKSAGNDPPDLFQGRVNFLQPLIDADAMDLKPAWKDCGARDSIVQEDGGITENIQAWGLAYNTDKIQPDALPSTWAELADPTFRGAMSIDPRGFPFDLLTLASDEQTAVDLVTSLKDKVQPVITEGGTAGLTQLATGEVSIRPALVPDVKQNQAKGAPLALKYLTPVPVQKDALYMPQGIKHPNAAMLFAIWYTSEDGGQKITREINFRDNSDPADLPAGAEVVSAKTPEDAAKVGAANAKIVAIWSGK